MASVEIYVKTTCPYCIRAIRLLDSKGVDYRTYVVDHGGEQKQEMVDRASGRTTVPQIFIDDRHIGGCDDLFSLERQGRLESMLAA